MAPAKMHAPGDPPSALPSGGGPAARLRLYVARSTPNSVRAEHNLSAVLDRFQDGRRPPELEIVDVFAEPRRAATEGIVVTPTLIGIAQGKRIVLMGDLSDQAQLHRTLEDLLRDAY